MLLFGSVSFRVLLLWVEGILLSASCGPVTVKSFSAGRWAPERWWLQLGNLVIASGPHPQFALGPSTCVLPSYLRVLAFSPSCPHCGWPGCSTPSRVIEQLLSSLRHHFHIKDLPKCRVSSCFSGNFSSLHFSTFPFIQFRSFPFCV